MPAFQPVGEVFDSTAMSPRRYGSAGWACGAGSRAGHSGIASQDGVGAGESQAGAAGAGAACEGPFQDGRDEEPVPAGEADRAGDADRAWEGASQDGRSSPERDGDRSSWRRDEEREEARDGESQDGRSSRGSARSPAK
ncbi:hypothetical protein Asi03nite_35350 [Actinoplanes siamensis]|uniref:Uncharacterized protein n=1 Tax=Actinoplanes siamensis TaxID=1223317 RepID=A0A919N7R2_9ACTN|nr:hypothetical protein Asi03nite_35350 [Actinoplanes siamensis]